MLDNHDCFEHAQTLCKRKDGNYIYTWNLFVVYFGASILQKKAFSNQNKGSFGFQVYIEKKVIISHCQS